MARKITVALSQSPHVTPHRRDMEEDLIGLLLMEAGVDCTVVPHVEDLHDDDTGRLCLEQVPGNLVVLAWMDGQAAFEELKRLGLKGRAGRTCQSPRDDSVNGHGRGRSIFCLNLEEFASSTDAAAEVCRIRDEQSTELVGLNLGIAPVAASNGISLPMADAPSVSACTPSSPSHVTPTTNGATAVNGCSAATKEIGPRGLQGDDSMYRDSDSLDDEIDDLVDGFDQLDF